MTKITKLLLVLILGVTISPVEAHKKKSPEVKAEGLIISNAWARAGKPNSAAFMKIINTTDEDLKIVSAKAEKLTKKTELHDHIWANDVMQMREVEAIELPAKQMVELKPGGKHVMFFELGDGLKAGQQVNVQLTLDNGKTVDLNVPVKPMRYRGDKNNSKTENAKEECPCTAKKESEPCPCPGNKDKS